jgi:hypothetical protein
MKSSESARPPGDPELFGIFWREMLKESDRGFVLIACGYLEELLKNLIVLIGNSIWLASEVESGDAFAL